MSDIEIDLLQQHPTNQVLNNEQASYSGSNKFRNTESIPSRQLRVHSRYDHDGYVGSSWDALLPECGDDYLRRDSTTYEPNPRAAWVLNVEADGADYFKQEISGPVMSKFVDSPQLFNQSEMGPPAGRSGKFIDTVYYWRNPGERSGDTKHVAFIGDFTRNVLIPQLWLSGSIEQNSNQVALSRELRGGSGSQSDSLAIEYDCPQIFCFDMRTFLFLQFRAKKQEELKKSDCLVDCWVFRRVENDDHFMEPIREVVYRFIVQGIRRTQCYGFPTANIYVNLPKDIVLKKELSDESERFENELHIYEQLRELQGTIIPQFLGLAYIDGARALVLTDIGGTAMVQEGIPHFDRTALETMLAKPVRLIREQGVHLADFSMLNVHFCEDAFRIVDFGEAVTITERVEDEDAFVREQVRWVSEPFLRRQENSVKMAKLAKRRNGAPAKKQQGTPRRMQGTGRAAVGRHEGIR
ncbi:hypothetical protein CTA2_8601 [Colletotrichum tanaceti]|uniref:Protein kinase domain-containing protein n=1 Tax=Colletotrichum tanaceti TaxID=1306861 RepID=A0A4V6DFH9_9PEZI|nr:hypothetical protein CTA2_8601 [Colletotrichum tanaceti]TKW49196.1 hypothetical protein CTA1_3226 [Colletotrichum tanaceti]